MENTRENPLEALAEVLVQATPCDRCHALGAAWLRFTEKVLPGLAYAAVMRGWRRGLWCGLVAGFALYEPVVGLGRLVWRAVF